MQRGCSLRSIIALALLVGGTPAGVAGQEPSPPAACGAEEHRQFDFWLGEWEVSNPAGERVGTNRITRASDGCALLEAWRSARGSTGTSLNYHDPADSAWHQLWVGGDGTILHLRGRLRDGAMVLEGPDRGTPRGPVRDRIRWSPRPDGSVEQVWHVSRDGGATWELAFHGVYRRR